MPEIIIENGPQKGQRITLDPPGPFVFGRDSSASVPIRDPMASRKHCRIELRNGSYILVDAGSANGTFLNGTRRARHELSKGDRIKIGETLLTFFPDRVDDELIGKVISGFEVLERIGQGGMGTVYKARQISLDRLVALKVLSRELAADRSFAEAFHREARAAGQVNHPAIVQVYDVDTVQVDGQEITFFAMEYMPGGSVEDLLNRQKKLTLVRALDITLDTARGICFAEKRGLVHRDIKPGNLMISESGMVKIGDLGIARRAEAGAKVSQEDGVSGSPHYISPEQARGEDLDSGADIYSLGVSLYHMLAGRPPFVGSNAKELVLKHLNEPPPDITKLRSGLPAEVVALVTRMMAKSRAERYPDAGELIDELERIVARLKSPPAQFRRRPSPRRVLMVAGTVALLLALGTFVGVAVHFSTQRFRQAQSELELVRGQIESALGDLESSLETDDLEDAREARQRLDELFEKRRILLPQLEDLVVRFTTARASLDRLEAAAQEEGRAREAQTALEKALERQPGDLATITDPDAFGAFVRPLEQVVKKYPGTLAAETALGKIDTLESARNALTKKLRRAREGFDALELKLKTLLGFDPPAFKSALDATRDYVAKHAGTPYEREARAKLETTRLAMIRHVTRILARLESASEKTRRDVIRQLQRVRLEVEGDALERIDEALGK